MKYTNLGLVEFVKSKLNVPTIYMLSGFGRKLTKAQVDKRVAQGCSHTRNNYRTIIKGVGKYCYDCVGLIKGYIWETSPGKVRYNVPRGSDQNAAMMYAKNKGRGPIKTMSEIPGLIVYMKGHVGVYIGNGEVVEATPAFGAWKVIKTKLQDRKWTHWLKYNFIDYVEPAFIQSPAVKQYIVIKGDTLTHIAKKFKLKWTNIAKLNNIRFPYLLKIGQVLKLQDSRAKIHVVKRGDSLSKISKKYSMPMDVLYQDNIDVVGSDRNTIIPGQKLVIREWI